MRALPRVLFVACLLPAGPALAESWCADALIVHEWGVQAFRADGGAPEAVAGASFFYESGPEVAYGGPRVRDLPRDSGARALPILHFYRQHGWFRDAVPLAVEVGFATGRPTVWYPQVSELGASQPQLSWENLTLTSSPPDTVPDGEVEWVGHARAVESLWVQAAETTERFLFYEGTTAEEPALRVVRGDTWSEERGHYLVRNDGFADVHDVLVVHRDGDDSFLFFAPAIPAGAYAGFLASEHQVAAGELAATGEAILSRELVRADDTMSVTRRALPTDECVMMRDPAVPERQSWGHGLYEAELVTLLSVWSDRFFGAEGTTIVYREDEGYLDAMVPLAIYTDMFHYPALFRTSLAVIEGATL